MNDKLKRVKGDTYYGDRAKQYEAVRRQQGWWSVEQKAIKTALEKLPKGLKVLDVPFGTGRFARYYDEREFEIFGLDSSDDMLEAARSELGEIYEKCKTYRGFSTQLPLEDGQVDLVVSTRFLRDIIVFADAKKTLAEFSRVCTKYAILQIGERADGKPGRLPLDDERMSSLMDAEQNASLLLEYGFKIVDKVKVKGSRANDSNIYNCFCERV